MNFKNHRAVLQAPLPTSHEVIDECIYHLLNLVAWRSMGFFFPPLSNPMGRAGSVISVFPWSLFHFRTYHKAVAVIFFKLSTTFISAFLFRSHLGSLTELQSQLRALERRRDPLCAG